MSGGIDGGGGNGYLEGLPLVVRRILLLEGSGGRLGEELLAGFIGVLFGAGGSLVCCGGAVGG